MTRRRRWGSQREGTTLVSNQFHVFHSLEHPKRFTELSREEKREAIEVTWERKGRVKRGENNQASNHTPK